MAEAVDFDLSDKEIKAALREFNVPNHEIDGMVMNVMRLATSKEFYESKRSVDGVPEYGFRTSDIVHAYDYEENTRESVRKDALNPLRNYGVLQRDQPVPRSPNTYYFLTTEFRSMLKDAPFQEYISEPEDSAHFDGSLDLEYHEEIIELEPGKHSKLMAESLSYLIPKITSDPKLIYGAIDDEKERENVKDGKLHIKLDDNELKLPKYPDIIVLDEEDNAVYLIEAVVSLNPFTSARVDEIKSNFKEDLTDEEMELVFISAFPSESEYRKHLMPLANDSYIWLSNHKNTLRQHRKMEVTGDIEIHSRHSI